MLCKSVALKEGSRAAEKTIIDYKKRKPLAANWLYKCNIRLRIHQPFLRTFFVLSMAESNTVVKPIQCIGTYNSIDLTHRSSPRFVYSNVTQLLIG